MLRLIKDFLEVDWLLIERKKALDETEMLRIEMVEFQPIFIRFGCIL